MTERVDRALAAGVGTAGVEEVSAGLAGALPGRG
jgi:hypothetical protein